MKILSITAAVLFAGIASSFGQGTIAVYEVSGYLTYTNNATYSSGSNGVYSTSGGLAAATANAYYYALLIQPATNGTISTINPLDPNYSVGMLATNFGPAGGIRGPGAGSGTAVTPWAAPTAGTYSSAANQDYYLLVGWSANLGSTWSAVSAELNSSSWTTNGFFGVSKLGLGYAGGGPNSLTAPNIFGTGVNAGGLTTGVTLYAVSAVPEPSTMALAALGGASLLLFRRRQSKK